jgi:hypothetical protein
MVSNLVFHPKCKLRVFQNKVPRKDFCRKTKEVLEEDWNSREH